MEGNILSRGSYNHFSGFWGLKKYTDTDDTTDTEYTDDTMDTTDTEYTTDTDGTTDVDTVTHFRIETCSLKAI